MSHVSYRKRRLRRWVRGKEQRGKGWTCQELNMTGVCRFYQTYYGFLAPLYFCWKLGIIFQLPGKKKAY